MNFRILALGAFGLLAIVAACSSTSSQPAGDTTDGGAQDATVADSAITDAPIGPVDTGLPDVADAAAVSTFTAIVDGVPRTVTYLTGHRVPFFNDIGVHARLAAADDAGADAGFDDIVIHLPMTASGVALCTGATLELSVGATQFVTLGNADAAACEFTGVSIGPLGGFIDGAFTGTVTKQFGGGTHAVSVTFHVLRGADSDLL
jgi:hypothetical protein